MNILLVCGKFSVLSVPFINHFKQRLPQDNLTVFILNPLTGDKSIIHFLRHNKLSYLSKKGFQLLNMIVRSYLYNIFLMKPKYISESVKKWNIKCHLIDNINSKETVNLIKENETDILITYDCSQILKKEAMNAAKVASINIHSSLLPKYRGTAPIYWVLKNNEKETGVTVHFIDEGVDTGDIILQNRIEIIKGMSMVTLTNKLAQLGAESIFQAVQKVKDKAISPVRQDSKDATYYSNIRRVY